MCVISLLVYLTITEYRPASTEETENEGAGITFPEEKKTFTFVSWNIGYGGQGKEMDFFYDGGIRVRPGKDEFLECMKGIRESINKCDTVDFVLLQEADVNARRSYYTNEISAIAGVLPEYMHAFAKNYDCRFVPLPLREPMGKVMAGLIVFSKYQPISSNRNAFTANFSWPKRLAMLNRCFLVMRFPLDNNKEFVLINTHNSAFDQGGVLRKSEFELLHNFMTTEFEKGNFVVAGGDWNNNPRGFRPEMIKSGDLPSTIDPAIDPAFLPGWQFVFDPCTPTNRFMDIPYSKGKTKTTIIDFFVVSPNIEVKNIRTISMGFKFSDHNPVVMKVEIKQ